MQLKQLSPWQATLASSCIGLLLWAIIAYKAATISMTHDESTSVNYFLNQNIWPYLFDKNAWPNANNHWLNTIFFQLFTGVFGVKVWAIRLASVLSYGVFALYTFKIVSKFESKWIALAAFVMIVANPYMMDFFVTARGYSISLTMGMIATYYIIMYLENYKAKHLIFSFAALFIASLALLSSVIYVPSLIGGMMILHLLTAKDHGKPIIDKSMILASAACSMIIAIFTFVPLKALSKNEEFKWGSKTLTESFNSMFYYIGYGKPYIPNENFLVGFLTSLIIIIIIISIINKKHILIKNKVFVFSLLSFMVLLIIMILARYSFNSYYPSERKTTMYVPFLVLILCGFSDLYMPKIKNILGLVLIIFFSFHFMKSIHFTSVKEWWYDDHSAQFMKLIHEDAHGKKSTIGTHWMFHPTLSFYKNFYYPNSTIEMGKYDKSLDTVNQYSYFIAFDSEYNLLKNKYNVLFDDHTGRIVLKSKN
jgi:hypothetical protein